MSKHIPRPAPCPANDHRPMSAAAPSAIPSDDETLESLRAARKALNAEIRLNLERSSLRILQEIAEGLAERAADPESGIPEFSSDLDKS